MTDTIDVVVPERLQEMLSYPEEEMHDPMPLDKIFPLKYSDVDPLDRVRMMWDLTGPFPLPKFDVQCGACSARMTQGLITVRHMKMHKRNSQETGSKNPYRCDVSFKCLLCSNVWTHGVVVTEEMYNKSHDTSSAHWRRVHDLYKRSPESKNLK